MSPRNDRNRNRLPEQRGREGDVERGSMKDDEATGGSGHIQVKDSMRQLTSLYLGEKMELLPSAVRSDDPHHFGGGGGADNREAHYCAYWLALEPTSLHFERMRLFLEREQRCFCGEEPFMGGATHRQLWYGAMGATLWLTEGVAKGVHDLAVWWFQVAHQLHRIARTSAPVGDDDRMKRDVLWGVGGRSVVPRGPRKGEATGANSTDSKMWQAIEGRLGGEVNQYDVGAYFVSRCSEATRQAIRQPLRQLPPMIAPLHAARFGDGPEDDFYVWFDGLRVLEGVASAGKLNGELWIARGEADREKLAAYSGRRQALTMSAEEAA